MTTQIVTFPLLLQVNTALGLAAIAFTIAFSLNQYTQQRTAAVTIPIKVREDN